MSTILTQAEFEHRAAAWADVLQRASLDKLQKIFEPAGQSRQTYVSFDLATTITSLLSTVSIAGVSVRFVLHKKHDDERQYRFGAVLFATDALGGRISAYYLNDLEADDTIDDSQEITDKQEIASKTQGTASLQATSANGADGGGEAQGQVPFGMIKTWIDAWFNVPQLSAAMFQTHYGPLQGYDFKLSDFVEPLFQAPSFAQKSLRAIFDLKTYYPAYPENPAAPTQTFGLVLRLHLSITPDNQDFVLPANAKIEFSYHGRGGKMTPVIMPAVAGGSGGSSYDLGTPIPPGT